MNEKCWYKDVCTRKTCDACIRYVEMKYLMDNSGIPVKRQYPDKLTPDIEDVSAFMTLDDIKADVEQFVANGENLYITGENTGNGKTSWAIKIMLKYFDCIWAGNGFNVRGYFIHVPTFLNTMKDFSDSHNELKRILESVDLVIWDDIASARLTDYDITQLLIYIDRRDMEGLANIYTGNLTNKHDLTLMVGNRLASRIWNKSTTVVEIKGADNR